MDSLVREIERILHQPIEDPSSRLFGDCCWCMVPWPCPVFDENLDI